MTCRHAEKEEFRDNGAASINAIVGLRIHQISHGIFTVGLSRAMKKKKQTNPISRVVCQWYKSSFAEWQPSIWSLSALSGRATYEQLLALTCL